jgi:hypothetical protein
VLRSRRWSRWSSNFLLEPEPKFFWPGCGAGYVNSSKMLQKPQIFHTYGIDFKNHNFVAIYLKNLLMIIYVFKKHENYLKTMKIDEFFLIMWGNLSELEPEPGFLTSWSRSWSRTKMDRLRNTDIDTVYCPFWK